MPSAKHKPSTGTKQQAQSTSQAHTAKLHAAAVGAALKFKLLCYCAKGIKANWNQLNIFGRASTKIVTKKSASSGSCRRCSIVMPIVIFWKHHVHIVYITSSIMTSEMMPSLMVTVMVVMKLMGAEFKALQRGVICLLSRWLTRPDLPHHIYVYHCSMSIAQCVEQAPLVLYSEGCSHMCTICSNGSRDKTPDVLKPHFHHHFICCQKMGHCP